MKTKSHDEADRITVSDIMSKIDRAQALANTLADAAAGDAESIDGMQFYHVGLVIADELGQAREMLDQYQTTEAKRRKVKKAAAVIPINA